MNSRIWKSNVSKNEFDFCHHYTSLRHLGNSLLHRVLGGELFAEPAQAKLPRRNIVIKLNTRMPIVIILAGCLLALKTSPARALEVQEHLSTEALSVAEVAAEPGLLKAGLLRSDSDDLVGSMKTASGAMSFQTKSIRAGKTALSRVVPDRIQARIEVNGAVIDHEIDYAANTVTIRTDGKVVIDQADRNVLRSFQEQYGREMQSSLAPSKTGSAKAQELLWRLSEMYSEVPLGIKFDKVWIVDINPKHMQKIDSSQLNTSFVKQSNLFTVDQTTAAAKCNEQNGGGFINLHDSADVCRSDIVFSRSSAHDFCPDHGYFSSSAQYGCGSNSCAGRCGGGCGLDGRGAWYKDCLDHDVCNRTHNSQLGGCADEWKEAADDYLNGLIECKIRGCHT
jgi:hypothetical protein